MVEIRYRKRERIRKVQPGDPFIPHPGCNQPTCSICYPHGVTPEDMKRIRKNLGLTNDE